MTTIVVGVDGSDSAGLALQWAVREAELRKEPLIAVMAWAFLDQHHAGDVAEFNPEYSEVEAAAALDAYIQRSVDPTTAAAIERRTPCALPAQALLEASEGASLLVVGARGHSTLKNLLLGSVSQHCLHHTTAPIAIVRPTTTASDGEPERVVVGVDGSETSRAALRWAVEAAELRQARVQVVLAWHLPYVGGYPFTGSSFDPSSLEHEARSTLDGIIESVDTSGLTAPIDATLTLGDAGRAVLDAAAGADLVVIGSRGLGGFAGLLLGSVGRHVAHHAPCPVVVIPPRG